MAEGVGVAAVADWGHDDSEDPTHWGSVSRVGVLVGVLVLMDVSVLVGVLFLVALFREQDGLQLATVDVHPDTSVPGIARHSLSRLIHRAKH